MELRQLEAFVAVVREGSFSAAADRLNLSQPSLSARIRQLEQGLPGPLLDRRARPVRPTPLGELFLPYAERALGIVEAAAAAVQAAGQETLGTVSVSCPFSLATYLMPAVVDRFSQAFPKAELFIDPGHSEYAVRQLLDGLVDLALAAAFPKFLSHTHTLLRLHDEMTVATAPAHPLAGRPEATLADIWPYRQLLIHWGPAFEAYVTSLRQMHPNPGPLVRLPLAAALPMAHRPDTVTFMPRRLVAASGLAEIRLAELAFPWDATLLTRPGRALTPAEQGFVDIVAEVWRRSEPAADR